MPRARRDWTSMLADIRALLTETTSNAGWSDTLLLQLFNECMDERVMDLAEQHEGWVTDRFPVNIVADQKEYALPEGTGRVKRILLSGGTTYEVPLIRDERWSKAMSSTGSTPTARLVGELIFLEPPPTEARTNGLIIEVESAPARLSAGGSKLDLRFPDALETLLILDTVVAAFEVEEAQGDEETYRRSGIEKRRDRYAAKFFEYTAERFFGRTFSDAYYLGD